MIGELASMWRWMALRAVAAGLFGMATLIWPGVTLWALVLLWGAFAFAEGVFTLAAVFVGDARWHRGWWMAVGLAGITAGIVTFAWPSITALALLYVIAAWALVAGVIHVMTAVRLRAALEHEWALGLAGILSIALAVFLVITPGDGALVITWVIGWFAVLYCVTLSVEAWRMHRAEQALEPRRTKRGPTAAPGHATG